MAGSKLWTGGGKYSGAADSRDAKSCPGALPQMDAAAKLRYHSSRYGIPVAAMIATAVDDLDAPLEDAPKSDPWADWRRRLEDLLHDANLSDRSQGFLESLDEQLTEKGFLSINQQAAIERIEEDRDGGRRSRY